MSAFKKHIIGRKVTAVIYAEVGDGEKWPALRFDDGSILLVSCDPEGNGPGFMTLVDEDDNDVGYHG